MDEIAGKIVILKFIYLKHIKIMHSIIHMMIYYLFTPRNGYKTTPTPRPYSSLSARAPPPLSRPPARGMVILPALSKIDNHNIVLAFGVLSPHTQNLVFLYRIGSMGTQLSKRSGATEWENDMRANNPFYQSCSCRLQLLSLLRGSLS